MRRVLIALAAAALNAGLTHADGPSFDCALAQAPVEELICNDTELARLDGIMAAAYAKRLAGGDAVKTEQRAWLASRLERCTVPKAGPPLGLAARWEATPCLVELYAARVTALGGDPALAAPSPRASEPGFIHPACLAIALGTDLSGDAPPPPPVDVAACNRGNRHRPIETTDTGYLVAPDLENGSATSFGHRMVGALPDGRRVALTSYWGGGSGIFSRLAVITEPTPGTITAAAVGPGGDRCNGGLAGAAIVGDAVEVDVNATPVDFVSGIDADAPERVTGGLGFCAVCCVGTLRYRVDLRTKALTLVSATITSDTDDSDSDVEQCAFGLMRRAAPTTPTTLDAAKARALVADIVAQCGESETP